MPCIFKAELQRIDINKRNHRTVDAVIGGAIGTAEDGIPPLVRSLKLYLRYHQLIDSLMEHIDQMGHFNGSAQVGYEPSNIRRNHIEKGLRRRREAPYAQVVTDHDDGEVGSTEKIFQIVIGQAQIGIFGPQFLVYGGQFLVDGLQLLLGCAEFLVRCFGALHW